MGMSLPIMGVPGLFGGGDSIAPTCVITTATPDPVVAPFGVTITFSEDVTGFAVGDITVTNGTAGSFAGSGDVYTATITPDWVGTVSVQVAAGVCTDAAGNENTASNTLSKTIATYAQLLASYAQGGLCPGWWKFTETSGVTVTNYGYAAGAGNGTWTAGAGALGQAGFNSVANEAYLFDASLSAVAVASNAVFKADGFTYGCLVNPSGAGEGNLGAMFNYLDVADTAGRFNNSVNQLLFSISATGQGVTRTNSAGLRPTIGAWQWLFFRNDADKKGRIFKGISGTLTEFTYDLQTAWTGTLTGAAALGLGGILSTRVFAGLIDEIFFISASLTDAQLLQIVKLREAYA